jgi:hypothetical protein
MVVLDEQGGTSLADVLLFEEAPEDPDCVKIVLELGRRHWQAIAEDFFSALCALRRGIEPLRLRCYGASLSVYPSTMSRSMGCGEKAYRLTMGRPGRIADLVSIFEDGPDVVASFGGPVECILGACTKHDTFAKVEMPFLEHLEGLRPDAAQDGQAAVLTKGLDCALERHEAGRIHRMDLVHQQDNSAGLPSDDLEGSHGLLRRTKEERPGDFVDHHSGRNRPRQLKVATGGQASLRDLGHAPHEQECSECHSDRDADNHVESNRKPVAGQEHGHVTLGSETENALSFAPAVMPTSDASCDAVCKPPVPSA